MYDWKHLKWNSVKPWKITFAFGWTFFSQALLRKQHRCLASSPTAYRITEHEIVLTRIFLVCYLVLRAQRFGSFHSENTLFLESNFMPWFVISISITISPQLNTVTIFVSYENKHGMCASHITYSWKFWV